MNDKKINIKFYPSSQLRAEAVWIVKYRPTSMPASALINKKPHNQMVMGLLF
ncbi:hypothetical protein RGU75_11340 [Glaciimonas sp. CA11.2]|uniref:hypothetical protein n=1 Tax=Glaciimonas sp. CA11.2 TaxID=3048601 RepID=UPI002AB477A3|nr:hypothetical protein [Glaciimonas sp. CA11.2]MDY7546821.1 hypothetical protein [Glaciimonas sp. CA11.2]